MKLLRTIPFLFLFSLASCPDKKPTPAFKADCVDVCIHATTLGCDWARMTAKGAPCQTVCENMQTSGISYWDLDCRVAADTCATMDQCEKGR